MSKGTKYAVAVVALFLMFAWAVAASFALSELAVSRSQHQWCDTIALLTAHPVPKPADPAANPSRQANYQLYSDFVTLGEQFGC